MHRGDDLRFRPLQRLIDLLGIDRLPPLRGDLGDQRAVTSGQVDEQIAKSAAVGHQDAVTRLHQRGDAGFHPGAAGAGDGKRTRVPRAEHLPPQLHHIRHNCRKRRIELSQDGRGHGPQHPWIRIGGARAA